MSLPRKMVVEVWADVMCPYCYLGERMLARALAQFPHRSEVDVVWKSYQLYPTLQTDTGSDIYELLGRKGFDRATIEKAHAELREKGLLQGIHFNFSKVVIANTFNAHRLAHLARERGRQAEAQEALFRAWFTEGRNLDDAATLVAIGKAIGLEPAEVEQVVRSDAYADAVRADMAEARDLGIEAVPQFMFDRNLEVLGAEGAEVLLQTLGAAFSEWKDRN